MIQPIGEEEIFTIIDQHDTSEGLTVNDNYNKDYGTITDANDIVIITNEDKDNNHITQHLVIVINTVVLTINTI